MRYTKTVTINSLLELDTLHIGQWFKLGANGDKAQYLGKTRAGVDVARYGKFSTANAKRNKLQRQFALKYGSR